IPEPGGPSEDAGPHAAHSQDGQTAAELRSVTAMRDAVIVAGVRTPIGKAHRGALKDVRADDLAALVIKEAIRRAPGVTPEMIDDVILGCAMPEGEQGLNIAASPRCWRACPRR